MLYSEKLHSCFSLLVEEILYLWRPTYAFGDQKRWCLARGMAPTVLSHKLPAHKLVQENLPYLEIDNKKEISIKSKDSKKTKIKKLWYIYIQWTITQPQEGTYLSQFYEVNEARACDTEWSRSEREKQIFIFFIINTYIQNLKTCTDCRVAIEMHRKQTCGHSGGRRGWDKLKE